MPYWGIFPFRVRFTDLHGGHMLNDRWFHVVRFLTYHAFDAILRHITVLDEIYRSWRSCTLIPIYETYIEAMIYSLSLRWFLSRVCRELPSLACTSRHFDVIMLSFRETPLWSMDPIQLYAWMTWIAYSMTDALSSSSFSDLSHIWCHAGAYSSISIEICKPPIDLHDHPRFLRYTSGWWFDFIVSWYSVEPLLSHSARFTFSDIVVILGWSYLRRVDSRVTFFSGVHVRSLVRPRGVILELSGQIGYIWCHIVAYFPHLAMEMIILSQICYSFHYSVERYCICFTGHYSCVVRRDEFPVEHDVRVLIAPLARTIQ